MINLEVKTRKVYVVTRSNGAVSTDTTAQDALHTGIVELMCEREGYSRELAIPFARHLMDLDASTLSELHDMFTWAAEQDS